MEKKIEKLEKIAKQLDNIVFDLSYNGKLNNVQSFKINNAIRAIIDVAHELSKEND